MKDYKTIEEIMEITSHTHYLSPFDTARAIALTRFLEELESNYGGEFRIVTANPVLTVNRDEQDVEPVFTFGLWVRFCIGEVEYYLQMDENPFFDAYLTRAWRYNRHSDKTLKTCPTCGSVEFKQPKRKASMTCEYGSRMNDTFYGGVEMNAEPETIGKLTENLHAALDEANNRKPETYQKDVPSYDRNAKQTIYTR